MAITRKALRQRIGYGLREIFVGTVGEATTTTLLDYDLVDTLAAEKYVGSYVHIVSGAQVGTVRRISAYDETTGTITLSRNWTAPEASSEYEIHTKLEPKEFNRLINKALETLPYRVTQTITEVEGQTEYDLSSYTWITKPEQVVEVHWQYGETALEHVYYPVYRWRVAEIDGALTLLVPASQIDGDLVLTCDRTYDTLSADTSSTDCPEDWIECAARVQALDLIRQTAPADDSRRYFELWQQELVLLRGKAMRYAPPPVVHIHSPGVV